MKPTKILLVEDNPADVELSKLALQDAAPNMDIISLSDGQTLLNYLKDTSLSSIAVVILDLNMPRLGGVDVLEFFQNHTEYKKLPTVVFTSSAYLHDVKKCYELGANAYVKKPIDFMEYSAALQRVATFWSEINVLPSFKS